MNPRRKKQLIYLGVGLLAGAALPVAYFLPAQFALQDRLARERRDHASLKKETDAERLVLEGKIADAERHARQAEGMTATLRAQVQEMGDALLDARSGTRPISDPRPASGGGGTEPGAPSLPGFPRYRYRAVDPALKAVDWKAVGESYSKLPALLARIADELAEGTPANRLPHLVVAQIKRHDQTLSGTAQSLVRRGVESSTKRSALLHPAALANSAAAALYVAGRAVSGSQSTEIGRLVGDHCKQDDRRRAAFDPQKEAFLSAVVSEAKARREFVRALLAELTPEQVEALRPAGAARGRMQLDLLDEAQVWIGIVQPVEFRRKSDLSSRVGAWVMRAASIPTEKLADARVVIEEWVAALPDDFLDQPADAFTRVGMFEGAHVTRSAERVATLLDALATRLQLDPDAAARVRGVSSTFVPVRAE